MTVPSDQELLQGPIKINGYWADCKNGFVLGPILCDGQGLQVSEPFRIYNGSIPKLTTSEITPTSTTISSISTSISTSIISSSSIPKKVQSSPPSFLSTIALTFGILILLACVGVLIGFVIWARNQSKREKDLDELLNFDIDTSSNKRPLMNSKALSPFPDRPVNYQTVMHYGSPVAMDYDGYSLNNYDAMNSMNAKNASWNH
jgi:hypothetical protein